MFQKKMFKTLHQNKFLHNGKPSFQFLTLIQNSQKELKTVSLISSSVNFCRVQTTMLGKKYSNPNSQDFLNSLLQHQVVPVRQRTLLANQFLFLLLPQPTDIWCPLSQSQIIRDHPLVNPVTIQPQFLQHLRSSPHTLQMTLLAPSSPKSNLLPHTEKEGLLTSKNHLSSIYPILNVIQFTCPKDGISSQSTKKKKKQTLSSDVHEIYTIKYSHIYIFSLTFMLFCD